MLFRGDITVERIIEENILWEDAHILVCRKEPGMPVQSKKIGQMDMESALKNYLARKHPGKVPYLGVVHRLDQPVEGILVFAKTPYAARKLGAQFGTGEMEKYYLAVVDGRPKNSQGKLENYLQKDVRMNCSRVVPPATLGSKKAVLEYQVSQWGKERTLLEIKLMTGRHHQIRVQMAFAGMPLVGDTKYNPGETGEQWRHIGLCAYKLCFIHPKTNKRMEFETAPHSEAFQEFHA